MKHQEDFDPKLEDEEWEKGNEFFKQQQYLEAISHYFKALRRNPKDARIYSNRVSCYTNPWGLLEGIKDANKWIELDPSFTKGYSRKVVI
jgi:stress-induced-phosphoprotein 1